MRKPMSADCDRRAVLGAGGALILAAALWPAHAPAQTSGGKLRIGVIGSGHIGGTIGGLWVTCGRRPGKSFFDVAAALVGCGHVSGLLMRRMVPLALMLCADRVPIKNTHF